MSNVPNVKMNQLVGLFLLLFLSSSLWAQKTINWLTWEEVQEKSKIEKRKVFVDVYTKWCGWCKKMDKATFQQEHIAEYINANYYAVKFDAEYKNDIDFNGKSYKFVKSGRRGAHELAIEITRGNLRYPTVVFLDENFGVLQPIPGFQNGSNFEMIMTYFAEDHFKSTPWKTYTINFLPLKRRKNGKLNSTPVNYNNN
jgi:thioredoxin-related protein